MSDPGNLQQQVMAVGADELLPAHRLSNGEPSSTGPFVRLSAITCIEAIEGLDVRGHIWGFKVHVGGDRVVSFIWHGGYPYQASDWQQEIRTKLAAYMKAHP